MVKVPALFGRVISLPFPQQKHQIWYKLNLYVNDLRTKVIFNSNPDRNSKLRGATLGALNWWVVGGVAAYFWPGGFVPGVRAG